MRVLAFDTATPATAVALVDEAAGLAEERRHDPAPGERPGHAQRLLPLAHELLAAAGLTFAALDRIAVGTGPGTFTGLRIGVSTARALAQAAGAELVGVGTLRALAHAAGAERVLAVLDARRGEAFVAAYERGEEVAPPAAVAPEALAGIARPGQVAVGDGAVRFRHVLEATGAHVPADDSPLHRVSALAVAQLGAQAPPDPTGVVPQYVRLPDAELALRQRRR